MASKRSDMNVKKPKLADQTKHTKLRLKIFNNLTSSAPDFDPLLEATLVPQCEEDDDVALNLDGLTNTNTTSMGSGRESEQKEIGRRLRVIQTDGGDHTGDRKSEIVRSTQKKAVVTQCKGTVTGIVSYAVHAHIIMLYDFLKCMYW